jgi:hypothetical protein
MSVIEKVESGLTLAILLGLGVAVLIAYRKASSTGKSLASSIGDIVDEMTNSMTSVVSSIGDMANTMKSAAASVGAAAQSVGAVGKNAVENVSNAGNYIFGSKEDQDAGATYIGTGVPLGPDDKPQAWADYFPTPQDVQAYNDAISGKVQIPLPFSGNDVVDWAFSQKMF